MGTVTGLVTPALIVPPGSGVLLLLGAMTLVTTTACLPLRGGHGQHAGAGPGTLTVQQLTSALPTLADTDSDEIAWPEHDPDELPSWLSPGQVRTTASVLEPGALAEPPAGAGPDTGDHVGRHRLRSITDTYHLDVRFHPVRPHQTVLPAA